MGQNDIIRRWPEVVGKTFAEAEEIIRKDRPDVTIVHVTPVEIERLGVDGQGVPMPRDLNFQRVFVITGAESPYIVEIEPGCG